MGVFLILMSALSYVLSSYFGKIVTTITGMTALVTSFSRFALGLIIMFIYIIYKKKSFRPNNVKNIAIRAVLNGTALIMFSGALQYTTITNTNMLHMNYPVFVILFAPLITKEENKKMTYIYLMIIMVGSYIVTNPSLGNFNKGDLMAFISAILVGISILYLTMAIRDDQAYIIVFYVMLVGTIINLPFSFNDLQSFDSNGLLAVGLSAILGFAGQIFLTLGHKYVSSSTGALVSTSRIIMAALIGCIFLSEPINLRIIIGIAIITLSLAGISGYFDNKFKAIIERYAD